MLRTLSIIFHNGKQFIPDIRNVRLSAPFRGRPVISTAQVNTSGLASLCPTGAITEKPVTIDLGRCVFCGECAAAFPGKITFTSDHHIATNVRENLIICEGEDKPVKTDRSIVRREIRSICGRSMKLRQVSAAGDASAEWEMNASGNVQFDMSRFGIEFVASPRHADGIVITGPISKNMAFALDNCYLATPDPRIVVLAGTDAISGGIFAESEALDRSFLANHAVDLYIPGNPPHPLTIINGLLDLMRWD